MNMKLSVAFCFLVLFGAVCLTSGGSLKRRKRYTFGNFFSGLAKTSKKVIKKANDNFDETKEFVHDQYKNAENGLLDASENIAQTGERVGNGVAAKDVIDETDDVIDDSVDIVGAGVEISKNVGKDVASVANAVIDEPEHVIGDSVHLVADVVDNVQGGIVGATKFASKISKRVDKGVATISRKVYRATYIGARNAFDGIKELAGKVDFDETVLVVMDLIRSDVSIAVCQFYCTSAAGTFLDQANLSNQTVQHVITGSACDSLCRAALAKLEDLVQDIAENATKELAHNVYEDVKSGLLDAAEHTAKTGKKVGKGIAVIGKDVIDQPEHVIGDSVDLVADVVEDVQGGVIGAANFAAKISKRVDKGVATISSNVHRATYNGAKNAFDGIKELDGKVDFDEAVLALIDHIVPGMSNAVCQITCVSAAAYVMGPGAFVYAQTACPPLCTAALAKLEDISQDIAGAPVVGEN